MDFATHSSPTAVSSLDPVDDLRQHFPDGWEGVWSAPGRVNLIGEHVDYQHGLCLPMAIDHRCTVAVAFRPDDQVTVRSLQMDDEDAVVTLPWSQVTPENLHGWSAYVFGVLWALRTQFPSAGWRGMDIAVSSNVPLGAGLSSSAALECSVATAMDDVFSLGSTPADLIRACIRAENEAVGAATGGLDQAASVLSRRGEALVLDCERLAAQDLAHATRSIPWDLAAEDLALLVTDTRAPHALADGAYESRRRDTETAAAVLGLASLRAARLKDVETIREQAGEVIARRARHVITEIQRVQECVALLEEGELRPRLREIGALWDGSHASLRDDFEVTVPHLDVAQEVARREGAYGARMTGGGFGGSTIALIEAADADRISQAIAEEFAHRGWAAPVSFVVTPHDGARRDA